MLMKNGNSAGKYSVTMYSSGNTPYCPLACSLPPTPLPRRSQLGINQLLGLFVCVYLFKCVVTEYVRVCVCLASMQTLFVDAVQPCAFCLSFSGRIDYSKG